ncbi:MAG: hypothetical protein ACI4TW_02100 [Prevotella sp.]
MNRLILMLLLAVPLAFAACDDDDYDDYRPEYHNGNGNGENGSNNNELNQYEAALVGSYVSDDDPDNPFYLVLNRDRTGYFKSVSNGTTTGDNFNWYATNNTLTVTYMSDNSSATMDYYFDNGHLYVDGIPLVINNGEENNNQQSQSVLVGQWQGVIDGYYSSVWGLPEGNYGTVWEFTADGKGCQLDYDIYTPKTDYAYTPFSWTQNAEAITITYQTDSNLSAARISNHALTSENFTGTIAYGDKSFTFSFKSVKGFDWSPYLDTTLTKAAAAQTLRMMREKAKGLSRQGAFMKMGK